MQAGPFVNIGTSTVSRMNMEQFCLLIKEIPDFIMAYMRKKDKVVFLRNLQLNATGFAAGSPDFVEETFDHFSCLNKCRR